jgi:6-methylsalicylate decarboxylase
MIVDVHAHYFPSEYADFIEGHGLGGRLYPPAQPGAPPPPPIRFPREDLGFRLRMMEEAGVARQILSIIAAPYHRDLEVAVSAATLGNDLFASFCKAQPDRFSFWASLPLPHVSASVSEVARALDQLGAVGVTMQCFCLNETIAREAFEPIYAELDQRRAVVFLHPCQNALTSPLIGDFGLTVCAGASIEDAVAAMHLIARRVPQRFPNIRFIVPHFGGILPMLLERLDGQMPRDGLNEAPSITARRFFYDTVGWGSEAALLAAATAFGASQLLPGSDWPVLLPWESYATTFEHIRSSRLSSEEADLILHKNVHLLLGDRLGMCGCGS